MGSVPTRGDTILTDEVNPEVKVETSLPEKKGSRFSWFGKPSSNPNSVILDDPLEESDAPKKQTLQAPLDIRSETHLAGSSSWSLMTAIDFEPVLCKAELSPNEWVAKVTLKPNIEKKMEELTFCTNFGNEYMYILDEYDEQKPSEPIEHEASPGMGIEGIRMAGAGLEFEETPIEELLQKYERDFANRASHSSEYFHLKDSLKELRKGTSGGGEELPYSTSEDSLISEEDAGRFRSTFWLPGSVKKGFFEKRGLLNKSYKRRFFVLAQSSDIYYFTDDGMKNQRGELAICAGSKMEFVKDRELILCCEDRQWFFRFASEQERTAWTDLIQKVIDNSNVAKGSLIHSGYMLKLGFRRQNWKFRFFKLYHNQVLKYYVDENYSTMSGQTNLENVQKLECVDGVDEWPFQLNVITPTRTWQFRLRTLSERTRWKEVLADYLDIQEETVEETIEDPDDKMSDPVE